MEKQTSIDWFIEELYKGPMFFDIAFTGLTITVAIVVIMLIVALFKFIYAFIDDYDNIDSYTILDLVFSTPKVLCVGILSSFTLAAILTVLVFTATLLLELIPFIWFELSIGAGFIALLFLSRTVRRLVKKINRHVVDPKAHSEESTKEQEELQRSSNPKEVSLSDRERQYYEERLKQYEKELYKRNHYYGE